MKRSGSTARRYTLQVNVMQIDFNVLTERLRGLDRYSQLIIYIFDVQGARAEKLDYNAAAKSLGVDRRSIGRYISTLADRQVLNLSGGKLKLNEEILKQG